MLSNKRENNEVKSQVLELFELERRYKQLKEKYERKKSSLVVQIKNFMFTSSECSKDEIEFLVHMKDSTDDDTRVLSVKKITPTIITWDAEKLERNLGKDRSRSVIEKKYVIEDIDGLIEYLKQCGVSPKKFKSFLSVEKTVNQKVLNQMDALGEITEEDIEGCYTTQAKESYLRLNVSEDNN